MRRLSYDRKDLGYSFALTTFTMLVASLALGVFFRDDSGWRFWVIQTINTSLIGGSAFLYSAMAQTNVIVATKLNKRPILSHVLWGCAGVVCLFFCMNQINVLFFDAIESSGLNRPSTNVPNDLVGRIICACVLPAFAEEIVFRGTIAQTVYNHKSKLAALAISGALFSLFHASPAQTLHQFVFGCFLTLLVYRSGSLWTSVIVHFFNNALVIVSAYTPLAYENFWRFDTNKWALPLMIVGIVGFAVCVFLYVKTTKSNWLRERDQKVVKTQEIKQNSVESVFEEEQDGQASESVEETAEGEEVADESNEELEERESRLEKITYDAPLWVGIFVFVALWIAQLLR